jgi:hypothetical protein
MGPRADLERRIFLTLPRLEPRPLGRPARSILGRDAVYSDIIKTREDGNLNTDRHESLEFRGSPGGYR